MPSNSRMQEDVNAPLRENEQQDNYGTISTGNSQRRNRLDPDTTAPLLSWERLQLSFQTDKSSVYIVSSAIVGLIVLGAVGIILFFGLGRIFGLFPPAGHYKMNPLEGFEKFPSRSSLESHLKFITQKEHLAGKNYELAHWINKRFESYGIESEIVTYHTYLNYPKNRRVAIVSPPEMFFEAQLREDKVAEDPTSFNPDTVPTFHGYSCSGNVTAEIVYVNYGRLEDFKLLRKQRIRIKGKIVLVRYGKVMRGVKVAVAEKYGAVGVLIYSDPEDDGYERGDVYPKGPFRPGSGVQRGSVQMLSLYPGDPLTPGKPSTLNASRINPKDATNIPHIPSLPISYDDAYPLLRTLSGEGYPATRLGNDWEGGFNISYWTGPSEAKINLVSINDEGTFPIYNVIGTIKGEEEPEKEVLLGNHHDAWVFGAVDPGSGTATMIEIARTFGVLLKRGWRPRRTIKFCSWDGEEYGLLGSTEWVEDHAKELSKKVIAYLNVDMFEGTHFSAEGSPSLKSLVESISKTVMDHNSPGSTLYDNWVRTNGAKLGSLGSGSDFTPFFQHLGISSLDIKFTGGSGIYHSNYDSFHYVRKFGDPGFQTHLAMTQLWGKIAVTLADDALLPFNLSSYGSSINTFIMETSKNLPKKAVQRGVNMKKLMNISGLLSESSTAFNRQALSLINRFEPDRYTHKPSCRFNDNECKKALKNINDRLAFFERKMLDPQGIPNREFYKHILYAPGLWDGYDVQIFPALKDAIRNRDWRNASNILQIYEKILSSANMYLDFN